jgi:hypothetical protein
VRCVVCGQPGRHGCMTLTLTQDKQYTVTICGGCRVKLFGAEIDNRLLRLIRARGWIQEPLPTL